MSSRAVRPAEYAKQFRACPHCSLLISSKSWRTHMREHDEVDTSHGSGGTERGFDPLPERIENLKHVIERLKSKSPLSRGQTALLEQYQLGLAELQQRLERQHGAD